MKGQSEQGQHRGEDPRVLVETRRHREAVECRELVQQKDQSRHHRLRRRNVADPKLHRQV